MVQWKRSSPRLQKYSDIWHSLMHTVSSQRKDAPNLLLAIHFSRRTISQIKKRHGRPGSEPTGKGDCASYTSYSDSFRIRKDSTSCWIIIHGHRKGTYYICLIYFCLTIWRKLSIINIYLTSNQNETLYNKAYFQPTRQQRKPELYGHNQRKYTA